MSQRPTRQCSRDAVQKIKNILAWEECPESSEVFKAAAAQIEREFAQMKRRRVSAQTTDLDSEHDDEVDDDEEDDENDDGSAPDSEDVDSMYSDNASSDDSCVEDEDECESSDCDSAGDVACTTDVAPTVHVECQPDAEPEGP
jgi:hypothetical protein